ncbi:MAG: small basic protein [Planctomycetes bacterium]|nr:small basic protein [Planctomycetota bacterium]
MSMDKSLKGKDRLQRHRNVLTRAERIEKLKEAGRWEEDTSPYGLPKVGHRKVSLGKKVKEKKDAETDSDASDSESAESK